MLQIKDRVHSPKSAYDLERGPVVVFWELTRACALACLHCRANAQPKRHPEELPTEECFRVLDDLASFDKPPIVVLTGGDPFMRRDLFDIASYGLAQGLPISLSPSATALVTRKRLTMLSKLGVSRISFSLDAAEAEVHDRFRGVAGSHERTVHCILTALDIGMSVQVNTTVTQRNKDNLGRLTEQVAEMGVPLWDLFFLVPTGRASIRDMLTPRQHEEIFHWVLQMERKAPFNVKVTLAQPYRRVWISSLLALEGKETKAFRPEDLLNVWTAGAPANDGKGIMFISHLGYIQPSGFLPIPVGNVRENSVLHTYRKAPLMQALRNSENLKGKCRTCPFRMVCGGCRARAYALTGDPLGPDPTCKFEWGEERATGTRS